MELIKMCSINRTAGPPLTIRLACSPSYRLYLSTVHPPAPPPCPLVADPRTSGAQSNICVQVEPRRRGKCYLCQLIQPVVAGRSTCLLSLARSSLCGGPYGLCAAGPPALCTLRTTIGKIGGFAVTVQRERIHGWKICFSRECSRYVLSIAVSVSRFCFLPDLL